jgi:hypothetical protein
VIYFCPEMNLIFIGVVWHLHVNVDAPMSTGLRSALG